MKELLSDWIGIIITVVLLLLLATALFLFWGRTEGFIDKASDRVSDMAVMLDESTYTQYEGATVSGTEVVAIIKNHSNEEICITVNNGRTTASYICSDQTLATKSELNVANTQKKSSEYYINPNSKFLGTVVRDEASGGTITGVNFDVVTN